MKGKKNFLSIIKRLYCHIYSYADFVVFDKIILEKKAKAGLPEEDYAQAINYLKCSGCKVGLVLNFGRLKLDIKRVVY